MEEEGRNEVSSKVTEGEDSSDITCDLPHHPQLMGTSVSSVDWGNLVICIWHNVSKCYASWCNLYTLF